MNPVAAADLEFQDSAGEVLVHDHRLGKIHVMNPSAAQVLQLCDGAHDLDAIVAELAGPDHPTARNDIAKIIEEFETLGLLDPPGTRTA